MRSVFAQAVMFSLASGALFAPVGAELKVVGSTADLAYLAAQVGGELVTVEAIAPPNADLHFVEARPSAMVKLARADVALQVGLELDLWMASLIDGSRNAKLIVVDCSRYVEPLEVPAFTPDARHGDLHRYGNPHYWLGPQNLRPMTEAIVEGFVTADARHAEAYRANQTRFLAKVEAGLESLRVLAEPLRGREVVFYHNSWPYFCAYFGLTAGGFVEPFPGVPPSPGHVKGLIDLIRQRGIRVIAMEPYFDPGVPQRIARDTDARVVVLHPSIGSRQSGESYLDWVRGNLVSLLEVTR